MFRLIITNSLSAARATAETGTEGTINGIREHFRARDEIISTAADSFDDIALWFEHDLYDQLQLRQVLSLYAGSNRPPGTAFSRAKRLVSAPDSLIEASENRHFNPLNGRGVNLKMTPGSEALPAGDLDANPLPIEGWMGGIHLRANNLRFWNNETGYFQQNLVNHD